MKDVGQRAASVAALKHSMPYVRLFKGRVFVVKVGGGGVQTDEAARALVGQVEILVQLGIRVVLVHGGGPQATDLARALGHQPRFAAGRRITDDATLEATTMALNGTVNTRLLAACRGVGMPAVGLSGVDGGLLRARRRPPVEVDGEWVDYGRVGDLVGVETAVIEQVLGAGYLPVVSSLAADEEGQVLNVNADVAAASIAAALSAEKLILLTGAPGVLERPDQQGSLVPYTDLEGLERLRRAGAVRDGMRPKVDSIVQALRAGVARAHVIAYNEPDSLLLEVFTNEGIGTMIVPDVNALAPAERF